jgi:hypothetical protein
MALTDEDLVDFNIKGLGGVERAPRRVLEEYGDAFRYQLVAARWIQQWADRLEEHAPLIGEQYNEGYVQALREVTAHLRQGDFLPGGQVYDEMVAD